VRPCRKTPTRSRCRRIRRPHVVSVNLRIGTAGRGPPASCPFGGCWESSIRLRTRFAHLRNARRASVSMILRTDAPSGLTAWIQTSSYSLIGRSRSPSRRMASRQPSALELGLDHEFLFVPASFLRPIGPRESRRVAQHAVLKSGYFSDQAIHRCLYYWKRTGAGKSASSRALLLLIG